jgi:endonuclease/exonuclease/phosphatase family metal-dependent hydrolase
MDRFLYSYQETHLTEKRASEISYLWRSNFLLSPGKSNARGVLTLYSNNLFENLIYQYADPNGRSTWLVGSSEGHTELFVSIYAPNNGVNAEFYKSLFNEISIVKERFNVDNVILLGDLNVDLQTPILPGKNGTKIRRTILKELRRHKLQIITDKSTSTQSVQNTWNHGNKFSALDYIIVSKHIVKFNDNYEVRWGVDKSDHAAVELTLACSAPTLVSLISLN